MTADRDDLDSLWDDDKPARPTGPPPTNRHLPGESSAYGAAALTAEVDTLAATEPGRRNDQLNLSAYNLATLVGSGHLQRNEAWSALASAARYIGLPDHEVNATLASAFGAGVAQPRIVADLDNPLPPVTDFGPADEPLPGMEDIDAFLTEKYRPHLYAHDRWQVLWDDETTEEWIIEPLLPARRLVALFSPPKLGKSLLLLELAVCISTGAKVLGVTPDRPRRVLYVDHENDMRGDIRTRLQAMGTKPADLSALFYLSFPPMPKLDTSAGGAELVALVALYDIEVVVIDTISRAVAGEENSNDTWLAFYRNTGMHLKAAGVACIRLDHTGKDLTKGMRGGSAKYGDVDVAWSMTGLGSDTFRLECVAHRLPIAPKVMTVKRQTHPLRHTVESAGHVAAVDAETELLITLLDLYADAPDLTLTDLRAGEVLRKNGHGRGKVPVNKANRERNRRLAEQVEAAWTPHLNMPEGED